MRKQSWTKRDPIKNYFPLPNEIYDLGLSRGAISVYSFLLRREDRKTYQCLLGYREIGEGVGMCVTTVLKEMIQRQKKKYGWEFLFLGANIDAVETAGYLGITPDRAVNYHCDSEGTRLNYEVVG